VVGSLLVSMVALFGAGCGSGSGAGGGADGVVSCTISENLGSTSLKLCEQVTGNDRAALQQSCASATGGQADAGITATIVDGPCSHVGALGACEETAGGVTVEGWYYADPTGLETSADIQMLCTQAGETYVAP
jgi:hypothetical protein